MYGGEQNSKQRSYQSPSWDYLTRKPGNTRNSQKHTTTSRTNNQPLKPPAASPTATAPTNSSLLFGLKNLKQTTTVSTQQSTKRHQIAAPWAASRNQNKQAKRTLTESAAISTVGCRHFDGRRPPFRRTLHFGRIRKKWANGMFCFLRFARRLKVSLRMYCSAINICSLISH